MTSHWSRIGLLVGVLLVACIGPLGAWLYTDSHPLLPGVEGCRTVRSVDARLSCYQREIAAQVDAQGVKATLNDVERAASTDVNLRGACHLAMHPTGERVGKRAAAAKEQLAVPEQGTLCGTGYAHGVIIGWLGSVELDAPGIRQGVRLCESRPTDGAQGLQNCIHALGHTIVRQRGDDVAVDACATLDVQRPKDADLSAMVIRQECLRGAFMEAGIVAGERARTSSGCSTRHGELGQRSCYEYLATRVVLANGSWEEAADACVKLAPARWQETCAYGIGASSAQRDTCLSLRNELRVACFDGVRLGSDRLANGGFELS